MDIYYLTVSVAGSSASGYHKVAISIQLGLQSHLRLDLGWICFQTNMVVDTIQFSVWTEDLIVLLVVG